MSVLEGEGHPMSKAYARMQEISQATNFSNSDSVANFSMVKSMIQKAFKDLERNCK